MAACRSEGGPAQARGPAPTSARGSMAEKIKVLICDDHALFREGIKAILGQQQAMEVVGEAADGRQAVTKALRLRPNIVLMDVSMPDLRGYDAARRILQEDQNIKVMMLTMYEDEEVIARCLDSGAM